MEYGERPLPFRKARSWATRRPCSSHFREARVERHELREFVNDSTPGSSIR